MPVIPWPAYHENLAAAETSEFVVSGPVTVCYSGEGSQPVAAYLSHYLNLSLGLNSLAEPQTKTSASDGLGSIVLECQTDKSAFEALPNPLEAYKLSVTQNQIIVEALSPHGLFNGVQTLIQTLPATPDPDIRLAQCKIVDSPRFPWRGVLLDVGRHYYSVEFLKKILDIMAFFKMNRFHWHLTEDQGWRIEIKKYPKLTEFGAWRGPPGRQYGGFYTQEQVKEIVAYAAERFIEVIPEIELPGHCCAALACYPELSCTGRIREVPNYWGIQEDVYCAGNDASLRFLKDVFEEVFELFPSSYVHIGGDECPKARWANCEKCQRRIAKENLDDEFALQSWFIGQFNTFLKQRGKQLIGWDEILEGGLHPGCMVMSWRGIIGGVRAAKEEHQVIMTPTSHCYFDYRQSLRSDEPGAWFAMLPLEIVYDFDPIPPRPDVLHGGPQKTIHAPVNSSCADEDGIDVEVELEDNIEEGIRQMPDDIEDEMQEGEELGARPEVDMSYDEPSDEEGGEGVMSVSGVGHRNSAPMSQTSAEEEAAEPVVYSTSVASIYRHRPQHDWTLDAKHSGLIVGGQANVWTEYISDEDTVEYMLLPRLCAMSEALWSPGHERNWQNFLVRLKLNLPHLDARGFNYRPLD